jgi:hypothetical protein
MLFSPDALNKSREAKKDFLHQKLIKIIEQSVLHPLPTQKP